MLSENNEVFFFLKKYYNLSLTKHTARLFSIKNDTPSATLSC
jgi:hypothetical protein